MADLTIRANPAWTCAVYARLFRDKAKAPPLGYTINPNDAKFFRYMAGAWTWKSNEYAQGRAPEPKGGA